MDKPRALPAPRRRLRYARKPFNTPRARSRARPRPVINLLDLFAGIGGFALGARLAGLSIGAHYFSEVDDHACKIYSKNFPSARPLGDITTIDVGQLRKHGGPWLVTGGFPCQDLAYAGHRRGLVGGTRSSLWWEMQRVIRDLQPALAIAENVPGLRDRGLERVLLSLADAGYDAEWTTISAASVGAPHLRQRLWIVAYPNGHNLHPALMLPARPGDLAVNQQPDRAVDGAGAWPTWPTAEASRAFPSAPRLCRMADGVPLPVDRVKALGNAVVPQVVASIFDKVGLAVTRKCARNARGARKSNEPKTALEAR